MGTCLFIIAFSDIRALAFGAGLLAALALAYYLIPLANRLYLTHVRSIEQVKDRILVPVANPQTGARLVRLAAILAQAIEGTSVCVFHVTPLNGKPFPLPAQAKRQEGPAPQYPLPKQIAREVRSQNVPLYTKQRQASNIAKGILEEIEARQNVRLVLAGWPGPLDPNSGRENPVKILLERAQTNILVLLDNSLGKICHVLVPVGGGPHSRLALHLAYEIAEQENARITALHTYTQSEENEEIEDELIHLREIITDVLGRVPPRVSVSVALSGSIIEGVLAETKRQPYDLLVMGASEEWGSGTRLFGSVDDWIIEHIENCSVLLVRRYEPVALHWLRRRIKSLQRSS